MWLPRSGCGLPRPTGSVLLIVGAGVTTSQPEAVPSRPALSFTDTSTSTVPSANFSCGSDRSRPVSISSSSAHAVHLHVRPAHRLKVNSAHVVSERQDAKADCRSCRCTELPLRVPGVDTNVPGVVVTLPSSSSMPMETAIAAPSATSEVGAPSRHHFRALPRCDAVDGRSEIIVTHRHLLRRVPVPRTSAARWSPRCRAQAHGCRSRTQVQWYRA